LGLGYFVIFYATFMQSPASSSFRGPKYEPSLRPTVADSPIPISTVDILPSSRPVNSHTKNTFSVVTSRPIPNVVNLKSRGIVPGVIVLGMHRSGTSVLGGLLTQLGLKTGGPLIPPAKDNEKGFFERIDVVLQNDVFLTDQKMYYGLNTYRYDPERGLRLAQNAMKDGEEFSEGRRALDFLNSPNSIPYMLKDPRLCITLRTWLPLLKGVPAVIFAFRHPMDVALSLNKREKFLINLGLRLWYVYNRKAIEQSNDLCRVVVSHAKLMVNAEEEMNRVHDELRGCGLQVPRRASRDQIKAFVDPDLQHGHTAQLQAKGSDLECTADLSTLLPPSTWPTTDPQHLRVYREAIRVYCALQDGQAFSSTFLWDESIRDN
jgi:hypothetical protein